jgi:DAACS family dicarboxylate/amino acid:cation (Na+ or H+) symporter
MSANASPHLHRRILVGLLIGVVLGLACNWLAQTPVVEGVASPRDANADGIDDRLEWVATNIADSVGQVFLRLMFMVVVPLVFAALSLAVVNLGDVRRLGRIGLRTLVFTGMLSVTAVVIGIGLVNVLHPGHSLTKEKQTTLREKFGAGAEEKLDKATATTLANAKKAKSLRDTLLDIIPKNPLQEMVGAIDGSSPGNGMLAVMFFSLAFGMAINAAPEACATLVGWLEGLYAASMVVIGFAMRLAPYGAGCLVFSLTARLGFDILTTLFWFVLTVLLGLTLHQTVVYSIVVRLFGGMSPASFFRAVTEAMLTAFGTSSSNATLPTALRVAQDELKLPREVSNFVLTVGATGNQNGTALYEGVVVLFLAQLFGVDLNLPQQITVVLMSVLAGVGTAGVPGGSLPLIVVLLQSVGVPGSGIGVILGVDRLLDMCRTVLNVTGDLVVATCVARGEKPEAIQPAEGLS